MLVVVFGAISCKAQKDTSIHLPVVNNYTTELFVSDVEIPWGMTFLPDGSLLYTEIKGMMIRYKDGIKHVIKNVPEVYARGQGGLLDIALHPDFNNNGWVYFTYASAQGEEKGGNTALARAKILNDSLTEIQQLYKATPNSTRAHHFGSRIVFDKNGYVYFTIGDRGDRDLNPQSLNEDGGKVYRLHDDGRVPEDNPFYSLPGSKQATWSYGHRNQQGMVINPWTDEIWTHEHGPRGGDEINIVQKGLNYGWPIITYGIEYDGRTITHEKEKIGMEQPIYYYIPSIAPSGMNFITSEIYGEWKGSLLIGSLSFQYLERVVLEDKKVIHREKLMPEIGRVRNVIQGPDGYIYVSVENKGIFKLIPKF